MMFRMRVKVSDMGCCAISVLRQLDSWFEHYNRVHPHKALGYRSPREFRQSIVEKVTENAVGAVHRPHEGTTATAAAGSRPQPPQAGGAQRQP